MKVSILPFSYWGSKAQMAQWIAERLPRHTHFVDACAGSAVVLAVKPPSLFETLNDTNWQVTNFFRVLQDPAQRNELIDRVSFTPYSQVEFQAAGDIFVSNVEAAWAFFVRMQTASVPGRSGWGYCIDGKAGRKANKPGRWSAMPDHIERIASRFKRVQILRWDICELLQRFDKRGVLFFVDPPYLPESRPTSTGASSAFVCDNFDFDEFHAACRRLNKASVLVTHYPHPFFDNDEWDCVGEFKSHRKNPNHHTRHETVERLYRLAL